MSNENQQDELKIDNLLSSLVSEKDGCDEFTKLTQYVFPLDLNEIGCHDVLEYVVQQFGAEAQYSGKFLGHIGNRFASKDEPLRRERRVDTLHATFYFPLDVSSETVQVEFLGDDTKRLTSFTSLRFDVGLVDALYEVKQPQQDIIRRVRSTLDMYFGYIQDGADEL